MVIQHQTKPRMTIAEFEAFALHPDNISRNFEFIAGEIVEVVSNPYSSKIGALFSRYILNYLDDHDLGHVTGADGGYIVEEERYIPDVGFIRYEKQPELKYDEGYIDNAPDLAVEVLSPGNQEAEITIKLGNYLAAGTMMWLVDPKARTVAIFQPNKPVQVLTVEDTIKGDPLLPEFKLPVSKIFKASPQKEELD